MRAASNAFANVRVVEFAGLAPGPFCGLLLADLGASVTRIDRYPPGPDLDRCGRGKHSIAVNMKLPAGVKIVERLCRSCDVGHLLPVLGVLEKLGLGPSDLMSTNSRLIYARLSGFSQKDGPYTYKAGHDINFLALSGVLYQLAGRGQPPQPPINLLADFAAGGLLCAFSILAALFERERSGVGQVLDCSMTHGTAYLSSWLWRSRDLFVWGRPPGENFLDGGAPFYGSYETSDKKYMAVGAIEPQFYHALLQGLQLTDEADSGHFSQMDRDTWPAMRKAFAARFAQHSRDHWQTVFSKLDACVTPVLTMDEAPGHAQNRHFFFNGTDYSEPHEHENKNGHGFEPVPVPFGIRSSTAESTYCDNCPPGRDSVAVLNELGYSSTEIDQLQRQDVVPSSTVGLSKL